MIQDVCNSSDHGLLMLDWLMNNIVGCISTSFSTRMKIEDNFLLELFYGCYAAVDWLRLAIFGLLAEYVCR